MSENTKTSVGEVPDTALSKGGMNIHLPMETRAPSATPTTKKDGLDDGPKRGKQGEYLPASYKLRSGNVRTDR